MPEIRSRKGERRDWRKWKCGATRKEVEAVTADEGVPEDRKPLLFPFDEARLLLESRAGQNKTSEKPGREEPWACVYNRSHTPKAWGQIDPWWYPICVDFSSEQVSGDPIKSSLSESQNLMLRAPNRVTGDMERCDVASSDYRQTEATHLANITRNKSQVSKPGPSM